MFKVSFKETPANPSKLVQRLGNLTHVLIKGTCKLPAFWKYIPEDISDWIGQQKHIELYEDIAANQLIIYSEGVAVCHPDDKFDSILGERLAESRAKEDIYKFFLRLTDKLTSYYNGILFGVESKECTTKDCLIKDKINYGKFYYRELDHQKELLGNKSNGGEQ